MMDLEWARVIEGVGKFSRFMWPRFAMRKYQVRAAAEIAHKKANVRDVRIAVRFGMRGLPWEMGRVVKATWPYS